MSPDESEPRPPAGAFQDPAALDRLMPQVYEELRALANLMLSDRGASSSSFSHWRLTGEAEANSTIVSSSSTTVTAARRR